MQGTRRSVSIVGYAPSVHVRNRAGALAKLGYDVTLLTIERAEDAACRQVSPESYLKVSRTRPRALVKLAKLRATVAMFRRNRGDATYVHYAQGIWASLALIMGSRPLIVTVMGGDVLFGEQADSSWPDRQLTKLLLRRAELVTVKSAHLAAVVRSFGVPAERLMTMYWGVDRGLFRPMSGTAVRHELGLAQGDLVLLSPRLVKPLYNIDQIVASLPTIRKRLGNVKLVILDFDPDPEYRAGLERRVTDLGLRRHVHFVPPQRYDLMPRMYAAADIVVSVPSSDGMPMTVLEAMSCGKPNIVSDLPHYRELLVNGENVIACSPSAVGIADAVCAIATLPELCAQLVENGSKTVTERADLHDELTRLNDRLVRLIDGRRRRQPISVRLLAAALLALSQVFRAASARFRASPS